MVHYCVPHWRCLRTAAAETFTVYLVLILLAYNAIAYNAMWPHWIETPQTGGGVRGAHSVTCALDQLGRAHEGVWIVRAKLDDERPVGGVRREVERSVVVRLDEQRGMDHRRVAQLRAVAATVAGRCGRGRH